MTPITLQDFRAIFHQNPARARLLWSEGLPVALAPEAAQGAVTGLAEADFCAERFAVLHAVAAQCEAFHMPRALTSALKMEVGWLGRADVGEQMNPLATIGPALALLALAAALTGRAMPGGTVAHHPAGGVRVALAG